MSVESSLVLPMVEMLDAGCLGVDRWFFYTGNDVRLVYLM